MDVLNEKLVLKTKLQSLLKSLIELLELHNENNWRKGFTDILNNIDNEDLNHLAREIRKTYAGMGSFNDLILHQDHTPLLEENNQLDELRQSLYKITWEIASLQGRKT